MADSDGTDTAFGFIILLLIFAAIGAAVGGAATAAGDEPDTPPSQYSTPLSPQPSEEVPLPRPSEEVEEGY
jgi:hypothetical protein